MDLKAAAERNLVFRCLSGSRAYGTSISGSDLDLRGVFAAPQLSAMTPFYTVGQVDGEGDNVTFELAKFAGMLAEQNPNILEFLWTDRENILFEAPEWRLLREQRAALLTTKVRTTYGGYATSQIKRMLGQERWRREPQPEAAPVPADFMSLGHDMAGLGAMPGAAGRWTLVPISPDGFLLFKGGRGSWRDDSGNLRTFQTPEAGGATGGPVAVLQFDRKRYEAVRRDHANYWTWMANRNQVKASLADRLGYEPKAAGHLIRLLRTAHEALAEGVIRVRRPDAAELLAIRSGEWPLQRIMETTQALEAGLPEAERRSSLPRSLDVGRLAEAVVEMYQSVWRRELRGAVVPGFALAGPRADAPDPRQRMLVLDAEMTGWNIAGERQLVEVAAVEIMGGLQTGRSFHAFINPRTRLNRFATKVHGLDAKFLADKPGFEEVAPGLLAFIGKAPILCHNAASDAHAINNDLVLCGLDPLPLTQFACSERIGRRLLQTPPLSLDALAAGFGVALGPRTRGHSAVVDATVLASCLLQMAQMKGYATLSGTRLGSQPAQDRTVVAEVTGDGDGLRFTTADGTVVEAEAPPYPRDTHELVVRRSGKVAVRRHGAGQPDNPWGPALLGLQDGQVVAFQLRANPHPETGHAVMEADQAPSPRR